LETCEAIKDIRTQWTELENKIEKLYDDAKQFQKAKPKFEYYELMKNELH